MINLQRLKQKARYNNILRLLHDGLVKVGLNISFFYIVEEGLYREISELEKDQFPGYELAFLEKEDIIKLSTIAEKPLAKEKVLGWIKNGCICLCLKKKEDLVAYTWINLIEYSIGENKIPLKNDEAYLFNAYTLLKYRGKKIAPFIRYQCYKELASLGKTKFYSISEVLNKQSINFKRKLNARFVSLYLYISLFKKPIFTIPIKKLNPG